MFCSKCGNELNEGNSFCTGCGTNIQNEQQNESVSKIVVEQESFKSIQESPDLYSMNKEDTQPKVKKLNKLPVVIVAGVLALILLAGGFFVFANATDMFKSPKQIYLEIEGKNALDSINGLIKDVKGNYEKDVEPLLEKPYQTKVEMSAKADLDSLFVDDPATAEKVEELLGNSKIIIDSKNDPVKSESLNDIALFIKDNKLINGSLIQTKDQFALSVPALYSKYFVIDSSDIDSVLGNLGLGNGAVGSSMPGMISQKEIMSAVKFNEDDFLTMVKKYGKTLSESIDEEQVTLEKNVEYQVNDLKFNSRKITLSMDDESFKQMFLELLETAKEDDLLYDLTIKNLLNIFEVMEDAGYQIDDTAMSEIKSQLDRDNFKDGLSDLKDELEESIDEISFPDGVKMSIYVDGSKILGREISTSIENNSTEEVINFSLTYNGVKNYKNKNIGNFELVVNQETDGDTSEIGFKVSSETTIDNGTEKGDMSMVLNVDMDGMSADVFKADIEIEKGEGSEPDSLKQAYKYDIMAGVPMMGLNVTAKGDLIIDSWEKEKEKKSGSDIKFSIEAALPGAAEKINGEIDLATELTRDIELDIPAFDSGNSVNIGKADPMELYSIIGEVTTALQQMMQSNPEIMDLFNMN